MNQKTPQTTMILAVLNKAFGSLTAAEIMLKIDEPRPAIRKALHYLHKEGRIDRRQDANGVAHYTLTEKGKAKLNGDTSVIKSPPETPFTTAEAIESTMTEKEAADFIYKVNKPKNTAWAHLVEEAEQRGFAKGYATGVQEAQRAAYELGKESVISKLVGVLR